MTTQIAILMILLQILIGCGEHLDVCKQPEGSRSIIEDDKTTLKIPCEYLYKETDDPDLPFKIGQKLKCGDKIGTDQWTLYCSEDGYVKCGERLPAGTTRIKDDLKNPDYVKSLNETELHNKIVENFGLDTGLGLDEDGRLKTKLSELQKEELERLLKCKTFESLGESDKITGRKDAHVVCGEDGIAPSIFNSQYKRLFILNDLRKLNERQNNAGKEEIKKNEEEIKKLEKELEELDNPNLDIEDADWE